MLRRSACILLWLLFATILLASNVLAQPPKVTRIQFGTNLAAGSGYIMMPNSEAPSGVPPITTWPMTPAKYIAAGSQDSDDIPDGTMVIANAFAPGVHIYQGDASLFGDSNGYGMFLFNVTEGPMNGIQTDRRHGEMRMWRIKNSNLQMMGEVYGPGNISTVSMNNAVPSGTSVTVTMDMQGHSPHLIAIFGGTPTVTYVSAGTGTLIVQSSTITTKNAGGRGGD